MCVISLFDKDNYESLQLEVHEILCVVCVGGVLCIGVILLFELY